jgi:hypothetical protein
METFIQQEKKSVPIINSQMVFSVLKREGWNSSFFKEVLNKFYDTCEQDAEIEIKIAKLRNPSDRTTAHRANIKCDMKRLEMTIELYKKGVTPTPEAREKDSGNIVMMPPLKETILESLANTLESAIQQKYTWDLAERIETMIEKAKAL